MRREERVMRICSRAVELDPNYAQAWALLAIAQSSLRYGFGQEVDDGYAAAHTALAIDPTIAEAHLPMLRRFQERGELEAAAREMEAAIRLGPESWEVNKDAGRYYLNKRDFPTATGHYEKAAELMESDFHAWAMLSTCYQAVGDTAKLHQSAKRMISESQLAVQQDPSNGAALGILAGGYALLGEKEKTREWIERALLVDPDNLNMRYNFACVLSIMGETDAALKMLQSALGHSGRGAFQIHVAEADSDFDNIRDDPRFSEVIADAKKRRGIETDA
jgi:adenylate cyclase